MPQLAFRLAYTFLTLITAAALATPPATAANILTNDIIGPTIMIGSVAILMSVMVIEIWRQTGKNIDPTLQRRMTSVKKGRKVW